MMKKSNLHTINTRKDVSVNENKKRKKRKKFLLILIIIIIFISLYTHIINTQTLIYTAHYGEVFDSFETEGILVRNEIIYNSDFSGIIELRKKEGERIPYGAEVLRINEKLIYNQQAGLISYAIDGLEKKINPSIIKNINVDTFNSLERNYKQNVSGNKLQKGQHAYKIINNKELYIIIPTTAREARRYDINENIFINIPDMRKKLIKAHVFYKHIEGEKALIIIKLNNFIKEWLNMRYIKFEFIKNIYKGVKIPREAIFLGPEGRGVLLYRKGKYVFKEISAVNGNQDEVIVEDLKIGDRIVINPEKLDFGEK